MKLENQLVSLELSKQLKEAGYKQEGLFWWVDNELTKDREEDIVWEEGSSCPDFSASCRKDCSKCKYGEKIEHKVYVAPTTAELWDKLPSSIPMYEDAFHLCLRKNAQGVKYTNGAGETLISVYNDTSGHIPYFVVNSLAKMWLYIKKEKEELLK